MFQSLSLGLKVSQNGTPKKLSDKSHKILSGIGVHNGLPTTISFDFNYKYEGVWFDVNGELIEAHYKNVKNTDFCTIIGNKAGATVHTIEHVLSALAAFSVTNVLIKICGENEVPILDGSSLLFAQHVLQNQHKTHQKMLVVKKCVRVTTDHGYAELSPYPSRAFQVEIKNQRSKLLNNQMFSFDFMCDDYMTEIAPCKTYGFKEDALKLHQKRLALGASSENTVIIEGDTLINPHAYVHAKAFAAHKILDAIGDLYLAGYPIMGFFKGMNSGHHLNYLLLKKLFSDSSNYELISIYNVSENNN